MAKKNEIPNTNECQFYVTLGAPLSFMDKKYVLFGRVIQGLRGFKIIEKNAIESKEFERKYKIMNCGIYEYGKLRKTKPRPDLCEDIDTK